jgi:hypothetical protein
MRDNINYYNSEAWQIFRTVESYRPISLLPVLLKLFEKLLLPKIIIMESQELIPDHQFDPHQDRYAIIEQIHRIVKKINNMKAVRYCSSLPRCLRLSTKSGIKDYFIKLKTASQLISMPS